jgi:hypothetical protein
MKNPPALAQDQKAWHAGYKTGRAGEPTDQPLPGIDALAWFSGAIEGKADRQAGKVRPLIRKPQP